MFYAAESDRVLRFGDVMHGFVLAAPELKNPDRKENYKIRVELPAYSVVLTPCCSIRGSVMTLAPLEQIKTNFLKNEYFQEDLTRINRKVEPENSMSQSDWNNMLHDERQQRRAEGKSFCLLNYFIYENNPLFSSYMLRNREILHYMVDFKNTYRIKCDLIKTRAPGSVASDPLIKYKVLQLSVEAREELRSKIADFYFRPAKEDIALLES